MTKQVEIVVYVDVEAVKDLMQAAKLMGEVAQRSDSSYASKQLARRAGDYLLSAVQTVKARYIK